MAGVIMNHNDKNANAHLGIKKAHMATNHVDKATVS